MNWRPDNWEDVVEDKLNEAMPWSGDITLAQVEKNFSEAGADAMLEAVIPIVKSLQEKNIKQALEGTSLYDDAKNDPVLLYRLCQAQLDKVLALFEE